MRFDLVGAVSCLLLICVGSAQACGGGNPSKAQHWSLDAKEYAGDAGLPFLSPGNDSRINLQLLMLDMEPRTIPTPAAALDAARDLDSASLFTIYDLNTACGRDPRAYALSPEARLSDSAPSLADGEGSRCLSLEAGKQAFIQAVQAERALADAERASLVAARNRMTSTCDDKSSSASPFENPLAGNAKSSAAARDFAAYLTGAKAFYDGAFDQALAQFGLPAKSENAWLRETARYMTARTLLNKAQVGAFADFDGVPEPKVTDRASLAAAEAEFKSYLAAYPSGRYAESARGLMRRLFWLSGDKARLSAEYGSRMAQAAKAGSNIGVADLAQEIDTKFISGAKGESQEANLLAVMDLMRMRAEGRKAPTFPAGDLEGQAKHFAGHEALLAYLKAARAYYVDGDYAATLRTLGAAAPGPLSPPYLAFSRETLRGQALMASGQFQAAAEHWQSLLPLASEPWQKEAAELGLAMSWERAGTLNKVFLPGARISSPRIRAILLRHAAGPILLRMAVADAQSLPAERRLARFVLLFKEATRGQYAGFLRDFTAEGLAKDDAEAGVNSNGTKSGIFLWSGESEPYSCPALKAVIGELAANPHATSALLCLGEFVRTADLDDFESDRPALNELGGGKPIFPGEPFSRGEIYKKLIADPSTPDHDKAYALFRAINCYAPTGANGCGGKDVAQAQRKAWYNQLKSRYGSSSWAQGLKYYW
ncbi:MAG TPA: hypothetical protein VEH76_01320 [Methylocystis sp.]|nr:hypothetical protein [Methylocystis sp.]